MFIDNLPPGSNMTGMEAYVTDLSYTSDKYDVTSSVTCAPTRNLISNEEISCRLNVEELLSKIPDCPMERIDNRFDLFLDIQTEMGPVSLSGSKIIVITEAGIQPNLRIDFQTVYPPMQTPRINCLTGSVVDVPVVLEHTEVFYGETEWSLRINNSQEFRELIECELILEGELRSEGKDDIYMCILTVPDIFFPECGGGSISLEISARNEDYRISDSFETTTFARMLNLGLSLDDIETIECQIVNEEGSCIPRNPQQNISVRIVGNVPKYIEAFDFAYELEGENQTDTYCRREEYDTYECIVFITKYELPMPSGSGTTQKSRDLNFSMQVKHINYYQTLSETTKVEMEGRTIHDFLSAKDVLEGSKKKLDKWNRWKDIIEDAVWVVDFVNLCCAIVNIEKQLNDIEWLNQMSETYGRTLPGVSGTMWRGIAEGTGQYLKKVEKVGEGLSVLLKVLQDEALSIVMSAGPGVIGCIGEAALEAVDIEIENIERFESGAINSELEVPDNILDYLKSLVDCAGKNFWENIKSRWTGYLCMVGVFVLNLICEGCLTQVCQTITQITGPLKLFLTLALLIVNVMLMNISMTMATEAIAMAREEINIQLRVRSVVADYMEYMKNTLLAIAMANVNSQAYNFIQPQLAADPVSVFFISDRTGLLAYDDEICRGDSLTIKYNLEKLNQTEDFVSQLRIQNSVRPFSRTLAFLGLKGEYGPYSIDSIFRTDPNNNPSSYYTFLLSYKIEGIEETVGYRVYYNNQTCI